MTPAIWQDLARAVHDEIRGGAQGIIVTHGTDTMAYSAAAISFMIDTPVPIVFVGSQRSADRPSSDNAMNAVCAAAAATSDLGEVAVVMHATTSDDTCSIHRGTRVQQDAYFPAGCLPEPGHFTHWRDRIPFEESDPWHILPFEGDAQLALHDRSRTALCPCPVLPGDVPGYPESVRRDTRGWSLQGPDWDMSAPHSSLLSSPHQ